MQDAAPLYSGLEKAMKGKNPRGVCASCDLRRAGRQIAGLGNAREFWTGRQPEFPTTTRPPPRALHRTASCAMRRTRGPSSSKTRRPIKNTLPLPLAKSRLQAVTERHGLGLGSRSPASDRCEHDSGSDKLASSTGEQIASRRRRKTAPKSAQAARAARAPAAHQSLERAG